LHPELITDPDPKLQIVSAPAGSGSGCTTLVLTALKPFLTMSIYQKCNSLLHLLQTGCNEEKNNKKIVFTGVNVITKILLDDIQVKALER
jgi:hypothetical protein